MEQEQPQQIVSATLELNITPERNPFNRPVTPSSPSEWFSMKFPDAVKKYGCPFLEVRQSIRRGINDQITTVNPLAINTDFFAGMLGGDKSLGHSVVYYEPEMMFYYYEPMKKIYMPTTSEKLQTYYRAMMLRCAQELNRGTDIINLFANFRSDTTARAVINRAKTVLACAHDYFSATSPHRRVKGPEILERLMRSLCETMLEKKDGEILTVIQAFKLFCHILQQRQLPMIKRSMFKVTMDDLMRDVHDLALRRDVRNSLGKAQEGWKGIHLIEAEVLPTQDHPAAITINA